jgi:ribosomal protein L7/L12
MATPETATEPRVLQPTSTGPLPTASQTAAKNAPVAAKNASVLPTVSLPDYSFPTVTLPAEEIKEFRVTSAEFSIGKQKINVLKKLKDQIKYGYLEMPVTTIYTELKEKGQILDVDEAADALHPPVLNLVYIDEDGFHKKSYKLNDTIVLGKLSLWGQISRKPGDIGWQAAIVAGKIQVVIALILAWILMVMWSYKMWLHFNTSGLRYSYATKAKFGDLGVAFAIVAAVLAPFPPTRFLMAFLAALAPVWSFFMQGFFWWFVDSQITSNFPGAPPAGEVQSMPDIGNSVLSFAEKFKR